MKLRVHRGERVASGRELVRWRRLLRKNLASFRDAIREVSLRFHAPVDPDARAGCVVLVHLRPSGGVAVRRDAASHEAAVTDAASRLKRLLALRFDRAVGAMPRPDYRPLPAYSLME